MIHSEVYITSNMHLIQKCLNEAKKLDAGKATWRHEGSIRKNPYHEVYWRKIVQDSSPCLCFQANNLSSFTEDKGDSTEKIVLCAAMLCMWSLCASEQIATDWVICNRHNFIWNMALEGENFKSMLLKSGEDSEVAASYEAKWENGQGWKRGTAEATFITNQLIVH